jgi:predicted amidohydrolase YtcJ
MAPAGRASTLGDTLFLRTGLGPTGPWSAAHAITRCALPAEAFCGALALPRSSSAYDAPMARAQVLVDADVHTLEAPGARAEAVAWRDGTLVAVGARAEVAAAAGPDAETWSAGGATVLPGFIDAHHHACLGALYSGPAQLTPPAVTDVASLQGALAAASRDLPPERWLVATEWDELLLAERRAPTRAELDDAVPDRPLFALHYTCHRGLANSRALALAGIDAATPDPAGGAIGRGRGGAPDGLLIERGMSRVETLARADRLAHDAEDFFVRLARHHQRLVAAGITRIVDAGVPVDLATVVLEGARRGGLVVPMVLMPVSTGGWLEAPWDVLDAPVPPGTDGPVTLGPLKLVFDGAPGCAMCLSWWQVAGIAVRSWAMMLRQRSLDVVRTSLSTEPRLGAQVRTGFQIFRREEALAVVQAAVERGFSLATHAIGNAAVDVALGAYEAVGGAALSRAGVPRIEHATFPDRALIARIAGVGAAVVTQPGFTSVPAFATAPAIPGLPSIPLRALLDAGVQVAGSSDYPAAGLDPLDGIRAAVTRRTARGHVREPEQRIGLEEAVTMYTRSAAEVSGCADRCGTLAAGKGADLVVLDGPLAEGPTLASARVRCTVLGGALVFGRLDAAP